MAWHTGKTAIAAALIGDSNAEGSGGFTPPGGQVTDPYLYCYTSLSGQTPYSEANLGWRSGLDPNGTARMDEYNSYIATVGNIGFIGQLLGGNGNPGMQTGSTVRAGTGIQNYLYKCAAGGTTADWWANDDGWDTLARTIPAALAAIPGAPTAFDYVLFSLGTNDCIQDYTAEQFYTHFKTLRTKMISAGWWVPGTTQIALLDLPRNGVVSGDGGTYPATWLGLEYVRTRFADRIAMTNSTGYEIDPIFPVHPLPPYNTDGGRQAGEKILAHIPKQRSTISIGGTRISVGGKKVLVHPA